MSQSFDRSAWQAAARTTLPRLADDPALIDHLLAAAAAGARIEHAGELALAWAVCRGDPSRILEGGRPGGDQHEHS